MPIFGNLAQEHNKLKSILLSYALQRVECRRLVDFACGKGGDLNKYAAQCPQAQITCIDQSKNSLQVLTNRSKQINILIDKVIENDAATAHIDQASYDVAVLNFALHYFCDTRSHAFNMIQNVAQSLRVGGIFLGTCIDYRMLKHRHRHIKCTSLLTRDLEKNPWSRKYRFTLDGCVVADEYVVYFPEIIRIAHSLNLHLVKKQSFNGFLFANKINPQTPEDNSPYIVFVFVKAEA